MTASAREGELRGFPRRVLLEKIVDDLGLDRNVYFESEHLDPKAYGTKLISLKKIVLDYLSSGQGSTEAVRNLAKLCKDENTRIALRDNLQATLPQLIRGKKKEDLLRHDVGSFLTVLGYRRPTQKQLETLLTIRRGTDTKKQRYQQQLRTYLQRGHFHFTLYRYMQDGGSYAEVEPLARLVAVAVGEGITNPLDTLRKKEYYQKHGFSSFAEVLQQLMKYAPASGEEAGSIIYVTREIAERAALWQKLSLSFGKTETDAKPEYTCSKVLEKILALSHDFFSVGAENSHTHFSVLEPFHSYTLRYLKEETEAQPLRSSEETFASLQGEFSRVPAQHRARFLTFILKTAAQEKKTPLAEITHHVYDILQQDWKLFPALEKTYQRIKLAHEQLERSGTEVHLSPLGIYPLVAQATSEQARFRNDEKNRDAIQKHFWGSYRATLLQASYEGKFKGISPETLQYLLEEPWRMLAKEHADSSSSAQVFLQIIGGYAQDLQRFGEEKVLALDTQLRKLYEFDKKSLFPDRERYLQRTKIIYNLLHTLPLHAECCIQQGAYDLEAVMQKIFNRFSPSLDQLAKAMTLFTHRAVQKLEDVEKETPEQRQRMYEDYAATIVQKPTLKELIEELQTYNLELSTSERRALYEESAPFLARFASYYGRASFSTMKTIGIDVQHFAFPLAEAQRISLPEYCSVLGTKERNAEVLYAFAALQAASHRFGNFEETENGDLATAFRNQFSRFGNPFFAQEVWSILTYRRALAQVEEAHPKLYAEVKFSLQRLAQEIKQRRQEGVLSPPLGKELFLRSLEQIVVLEMTPDDSQEKKNAEEPTPKEVEQVLHSLPASWTKITNGEVLSLVERIYEQVKENYALEKKKQQQEQQQRTSPTEGVALAMQTGADYSAFAVSWYPECSGRKKARVIMKPVSDIPNTTFQQVREKHATEIQQLKRYFERLKPERVLVERHAYEGELDEDAFMEMQFELRAGLSPDTNIFVNRRIHERDVAILLTLNQDKMLGKWITAEKRNLDYARTLLLALSESARRLEDVYAVMGYASRGANEVMVNVFKDFTEAPDEKVDYRLGLISALYKSRTGAAYRHFGTLFSQQPAKRKIHIDIVTQLAADDGYNGDEAVLDTAQAAQFARAQGVELYALCLDAKTPEQILHEVYGAGHYIKAGEPEHLFRTGMDLYKRLML